ncbi:M23 family metallopeptidase [Streptomyces sp. B6B3]|uniref:M23 family metallopeptidase n=1 Tax=Streptomyces sp. B6B3 TaxID=3153570 RepID=UPI00325C8AB7
MSDDTCPRRTSHPSQQSHPLPSAPGDSRRGPGRRRRRRGAGCEPGPARMARRAAASALLGAVVITGPWTVPAVGHEALPHLGERGEQGHLSGPTGVPVEPYAPYAPYVPHAPHVPYAPFDGYGGYGDGAPWAAFATETRTAPVTGYPVSAAYGIPGGWAAGYHTGVDFATPVGTPVRSVGPGTVVLAEDSGDYGNTVLVEMTDGYYALYAHLSEISVSLGEWVDTGEGIGETGDTGRTSGPHLHFEIRTGPGYGTDVDPLAYLARYGASID